MALDRAGGVGCSTVFCGGADMGCCCCWLSAESRLPNSLPSLLVSPLKMPPFFFFCPPLAASWV